MKMRELERRTGVNRETIRVYLRLGLLPEPLRSARNVADYGEEHVRGILSIRQLQHDQRLPLARIQQAVDGDASAVPADAGILRQIEQLIGSKLGSDESLVSVATLTKTNPRAASDARALHRIGAVRLRRRKGQLLLSPADARLVGLWDSMRAAGFTEQRGFTPAVAKMHVDAARKLARSEVRVFLAELAGREAEAPAARMVDAALSTMLAFFGLVRTRAVLEEFRARSGSRRTVRRGSRPIPDASA
jgi:DNA-binding transcriptional MerR regulator